MPVNQTELQVTQASAFQNTSRWKMGLETFLLRVTWGIYDSIQKGQGIRGTLSIHIETQSKWVPSEAEEIAKFSRECRRSPRSRHVELRYRKTALCKPLFISHARAAEKGFLSSKTGQTRTYLLGTRLARMTQKTLGFLAWPQNDFPLAWKWLGLKFWPLHN